ncbi:hypothetical protein CPT_Mater67 [Bacillus phage Mater]|uniref:Uncharacterized protein n=1 Tax=Bacillus phage Mater TaxID=1540090 RepID=A0A0A0RNK4_9CAUD|nr:hypothetical protein CPT_Mater67 [Bacillus phage Mater]AIW03224.1 hypothetical protein CPT_Mater67 [Bacillus phage Mater]
MKSITEKLQDYLQLKLSGYNDQEAEAISGKIETEADRKDDK